MRNNNTIKLNNKDIHINIAVIIVLFIMVYVCIYILIAAKKEPITTYKVNASNINNNITLNGIILRSEIVTASDKAGYICYYMRDGEKAEVNSTVCTVDSSGSTLNAINDSDTYAELLTSNDYSKIRDSISNFKLSYSDDTFYDTYDFKNDIDNELLELINGILISQSDAGALTGLSPIASASSGIITYYTDGFEGYDINSITSETFDRSSYSKISYNAGDSIEAGALIFKTITSEHWNIIAPITSEQITALSESSYVTFKLNNSTYEIIMPYTILNLSDGQYINISLDKYMINFLSERYVTVEIIMDDLTGLKVPVSSVTEKTVYKLPKAFVTAGSNQTAYNQVSVQTVDKEGKSSIKQVSVQIYKSDDSYYYVDSDDFELSDVLIAVNDMTQATATDAVMTNSSVAVSTLETDKVTGVYLANRGVADFTIINIIKTIDDNVIISNTSDDDVLIYDNIVLDASKVKDNQILY